MVWHAVEKPVADKRARGIAQPKRPALQRLPVEFCRSTMLSVMRDPAADHKRRDAMAMAAAPYLHPKLTAIDAKLSPAAGAGTPEEPSSIRIEFVVPSRHDALEDQE